MTDTQPRDFADFLREQANGRTHAELTDALAEVVSAIRDTGKKGSIALTITITPVKNGGGVLTVADAVKKVVPQHDRRTSMFYPTRTGSLVKDDPAQPSFDDLRELDEPTNVRSIPTARKENLA